jgi:V8-like Glu-specific endopeptidase
MISPHAVTEKLLFSTVKINTKNGTGTGFFFQFTIDGNQYPVVITNKHVVENSEVVNLTLHVADSGNPTDENLAINYKTDWIQHLKYDMCCTFFQPVIEHFKQQFRKDVFYIPLTENEIWSNNKLEELKTMEEIVMIGYPTGLWDEVHNLPLFRKGVTSTHPAIDFNGKKEGVIDAACFPGSSGSPVCILNEGSYVDKNNNTNMGTTRFSLLGILYAGPIFDAKGQIVVKEIPTRQKAFSSTQLMINLGYYIKASEVLELKKEVIKVISSQK